MDKYDFDLFTIGGGSGGVRASRVAASYGARVAIAEKSKLGGTCVNVGCIPKKLLVYAAHFSEDFADADAYGWTVGDRRVSWQRLIANKDREIDRLNQVYQDLLEKAGADIITGHARILDPHTVEVEQKRYTAKYILIATGGRPTLPEIPGSAHAITSNEAFYLSHLPESIIIVGGGYVGVEFAGIFHGLGTKVTLVHRRSLLLTGFDRDVRETLGAEMTKKGVDLRLNAQIESIEKVRNGIKASFSDGVCLEAETIMLATGRAPNVEGLGLENAGVKLDQNDALIVDEYSCTTVPSIYAVGDCTDRRNLTPVAIAEGRAVAETLFNDNPMKMDYTKVPSAVFSQPSVATVGLTEEEARERNLTIDVYRTVFRPLKHTLTGLAELTMMKIVVDRATDRVLGCHMVGSEAGEIIQGLAVALNCGATKAQFDATIGIHPTAAEEFVTMRERVSAS